MAVYPYAGVTRDAFDAIKAPGGPSFMYVPLETQRRMYDTAVDIILRGGATTPFELSVASIVEQRNAIGQSLTDDAPTGQIDEIDNTLPVPEGGTPEGKPGEDTPDDQIEPFALPADEEIDTTQPIVTGKPLPTKKRGKK